MLTSNQKRVFEFIKRYMTSNGEAPTLQEIGRNVGFRAVSSVHNALNGLEEEGMIRRSRHHRGIELVEYDVSPCNQLMIGGREG